MRAGDAAEARAPDRDRRSGSQAGHPWSATTCTPSFPARSTIRCGAFPRARTRACSFACSAGNNPPSTCKTTLFKVPSPGYDPRGVDVDSNGVVWTGLAASSHLASFDVRKCKDLNGPAKVDGSQCKEGWTLYQTTGPKLKGTDVPADFHYFNWVDQHNVMGLGKDTPFLTGSNSDSLIALNPQTKKWTYFKVPYPLGFYSRGMDARIDDPNLGWKGRALYSNYGTHFVWHIEGGKGTKGKIVKFQLRPDPLAR